VRFGLANYTSTNPQHTYLTLSSTNAPVWIALLMLCGNYSDEVSVLQCYITNHSGLYVVPTIRNNTDRHKQTSQRYRRLRKNTYAQPSRRLKVVSLMCLRMCRGDLTNNYNYLSSYPAFSLSSPIHSAQIKLIHLFNSLMKDGNEHCMWSRDRLRRPKPQPGTI